MSDDASDNIIHGRFTAMPKLAPVEGEDPLLALVREGLNIAREEGANPTQIVYVMLDDECSGSVGYLASEKSGASHPRALLALAATMIGGLTHGE